MKNIHNRNIEISTYCWDADHVLIVGELREQREVGFVNKFAEQIEPGIYHQMKIEMLISTGSMTITDISVSLPKVPREDCSSMINSLNDVKGMRISRGFSKVIRDMVGGNKGCIHLNTLLLAMAPAAMQGSWINTSWQEKAPEKPDIKVIASMTDSCWTWRKGGPLLGEMDQRLADTCKQEKAFSEDEEL